MTLTSAALAATVRSVAPTKPSSNARKLAGGRLTIILPGVRQEGNDIACRTSSLARTPLSQGHGRLSMEAMTELTFLLSSTGCLAASFLDMVREPSSDPTSSREQARTDSRG